MVHLDNFGHLINSPAFSVAHGGSFFVSSKCLGFVMPESPFYYGQKMSRFVPISQPLTRLFVRPAVSTFVCTYCTRDVLLLRTYYVLYSTVLVTGASHFLSRE